MNSFFIFVISLLLSQSFGQEVSDFQRKANLVSKYVDGFLKKLETELSTKNLSIPQLVLGSEIGKVSNFEGSVSGGMTTQMDGYKAFGFKLNTTLSKIALHGQYDIQRLEIPGLFPVFGKGNGSVTIEAVNLNMLLDAKRDYTEDKFIIDLPIFVIGVENSTVKFDNLMDDPAVTDFLNELLSGLIPDVVTMLTGPLLKHVKPKVDYLGNGIIKCIQTQALNLEKCIKDLFGKPLDLNKLLSQSGIDGDHISPKIKKFILNFFLKRKD